jgi:DNA-binding transcriptional LysR family regulator
VDPHLLRTFVAVVRCGSFSAAARKLGYTQSAVSQQVASLEDDLGVALLHRRPVAPTDAGARLLEHAPPILLRLAAARADVSRVSGAPPARLLVGTSPLADPALTAHALVEIQRSMPRAAVTLRVAGRDTVVSAVAGGDLDIGIVDGITAASDPLHLIDAGPLWTVAMAEGPLAIALPTGHPLATRREVRMADLADAGWIDAPDVAVPLPQLRAIVRLDDFPARLRYDGTDVQALLALVAAGGGLTLLPAAVVHGRPDVTGVAVSEPRLVHRTELVHGSLAGVAAAMVTALNRRQAG